MASLTNVQMWDEEMGWIPVTAEQASQIYGKNGIKADSRIFRCGFCKQYVLLTKPGTNVSHFRHSSAEAEKVCRDRTIGFGGYGYSHTGETYPSPFDLKLTPLNSERFLLELGVSSTIARSLPANSYISIQSSDDPEKTIKYSGERMSKTGLTYLALQEVPSSSYKITLSGVPEDFHKEYPDEIEGFDPIGTFFHQQTGLRLSKGSTVFLDNKYYFLTRDRYRLDQFNYFSPCIRIIERCCWTVDSHNLWSGTWYVFEIQPYKMQRIVSDFFTQYGLDLSPKKAQLLPIWPLYSITKDIFFSVNRSTYFYTNNGASLIFYPDGDRTTSRHKLHQDKITHKNLLGNQLVLLRCLDYTLDKKYFLFQEGSTAKFSKGMYPKINICSAPGVSITDADQSILPKEGQLSIQCPYDGFIERYQDHHLIYKYNFSGDEIIGIHDLSYGQKLVIYVGLDKVWEIHYQKSELEPANNWTSIIPLLKQRSSNVIPVSREFKNMIQFLPRNSEIQLWAIQQLRNGFVSLPAYQIFKREFINYIHSS